jgi:uncharacterized protein
MRTVMPAAKLRAAWETLTGQAGDFQQRLRSRALRQGGYTVVLVTCRFERAAVNVRVVLNDAREVAGLFFVPASAADVAGSAPAEMPAGVKEIAATVGEGEWVLPGTIALPANASGKVPGVVLVHGSGPHDRDETIGGHKPFRDLAWGLAQHGIATLRYDKRTREHAAKMAGLSITTHEEIVEDALKALSCLRGHEAVDARRVFVLGHSLGGTMAPRIVRADAEVAGMIVLAGGTQRLEDVIVEQMRYVLALDGSLSSDDEARLAAVEKEAERVRQFRPEDRSSSAKALGAPASYWLDLRDYDPVAAAKALRRPILILQGGRDYQVTEADFQRWQAALGTEPWVTLRLYPDLNHLFVTGSGKSTPAEYEQAGRVAEQAIAEIAAWIRRVAPASR